MADLTRPRPGTGDRDGNADGPVDVVGPRGRAQLILIGGFALAVTLVALALVMNAAIFTENLATRSESAGASSAHAYQRATANAAVEAFHYAHEVNNGTHAELEENVTDAMAAYSNITVRQEVTTGRVVNVSVATTKGTNITGGNGGDFTDASGATEWTLATDVSKVRKFTIFIDDTSALASITGDEFRVVARDGGQRWVLNVTFDSASGVATVGVRDTSGNTGSCTTSATSFEINVSAGTVDGDDCAALNFSETPDTYDLEFRNASAISGSYSLVANTDATGRSVYDGGSPKAQPVLYSMTVDVVYRTNDIAYRTDVRIAPGEGDV